MNSFTLNSFAWSALEIYEDRSRLSPREKQKFLLFSLLRLLSKSLVVLILLSFHKCSSALCHGAVESVGR